MRTIVIQAWAILLTVGLILALFGTALGQSDDPSESEPFVLTDEQDSSLLGRYLDILEDPGGELTIEDVISPEFETLFVPSQDDVPNLGLTDSAIWVRLPVSNQSQSASRWLLKLGFASLHFVDLYTPLPDGEGFSVKQTGILRPAASRDFQEPHIVFDLEIPPETRQTYYLRFQSGSSMTLPLTLWTPDAFAAESKLEHALSGIYFGALFVLLAYNLFLFISLREKSYLFFVMLLISMIVFETTYHAYLEVYLLPNLYFLHSYHIGISFSMIFVSLILSANAFLDAKAQLPSLYRLGVVVLAVWGILLLTLPFISLRDFSEMALPWALVSMTTVLASGMLAWRRGIPQSRVFLAAFIGLLIPFSLTILVRLGTIPSTSISEQAYRAGLLWMGICWSLALGNRVNQLNENLQRNERRLSQILEGLPLGVVMYEKDQKPSYINQRVNEILSNPAREIKPDLTAGRTLAQTMEYFSFRVAGGDQLYSLEDMPIFRALHGDPATTDDIEADLIDRRVPLEIWASPMRNAQGEVEAAIVAFQDITRRKHAEAELAAQRGNLEFLVEERTARLNDLNALLNREATERKALADTQVKLIRWLSAINRSHQFLRGSAELPQAHRQLLVDIGQLLDAKSAFLGICDVNCDQIELLSCLRPEDSPPSVADSSITCAPGSPISGLIQRDETLILSVDWDNPMLAPLRHCLWHEAISSLVLAPIQNKQETIGLLGLGMSRSTESYTGEEMMLFERIRFDLAGLQEYAQLHDTARALAATEERTHLARDLHDSVTQVLFSAALLAEALPTIWRRDPEQAEESLEGLRQLTRGALAEMRSLLLELRPAALYKTSLSELISQLSEAITSRSQLPFHLLIEQTPVLPDDVHITFYRVAQEALNNVVKHAQASRVEVQLGTSPPPPLDLADSDDFSISLTISDNGVGFSSANGQPGKMGLAIMRERAVAIGADLSIESQPARGTTVTMKWTGRPGNRHA